VAPQGHAHRPALPIVLYAGNVGDLSARARGARRGEDVALRFASGATRAAKA